MMRRLNFVRYTFGIRQGDRKSRCPPPSFPRPHDCGNRQERRRQGRSERRDEKVVASAAVIRETRDRERRKFSLSRRESHPRSASSPSTFNLVFLGWRRRLRGFLILGFFFNVLIAFVVVRSGESCDLGSGGDSVFEAGAWFWDYHLNLATRRDRIFIA